MTSDKELPEAGDRLRLVIQRIALEPSAEARYRSAHPRVDVVVVADRAQLITELPHAAGACGAIVGPPDSPFWAAVQEAPGLRWLHHMGAGVDGMLFERLPPHVTFTAGKGPIGLPLAEHAITLMLALARRLPESARDQQAKRWPPGGMSWRDRVVEVTGRTVLILGLGASGTELARICKHGFRMRVLGFSRTHRDNPDVDTHVDRAGLHQALSEADFVCLTLALTPETRGILDAAALAAMKPGSFLVNVARGEQIDESALIDALSSGHLAGAGLDVFATEPLPPDSPLWHLPNVLITPHRAAGSDGTLRHYKLFLSENIRRFGDGEPLLGVVDRNAGY